MIQKTFTDVFGATHTDGVHKLMTCDLDVVKKTATANFKSFHNKAAYLAGNPSMSTHIYVALAIVNLDVNSWDELIEFMETIAIANDPFFVGGTIITE